MKLNTILYITILLISTSCDHRSLEELTQTAESYEAKGDFEMANIVYDETIKAYPNHPGAYINKGANLAQLKQYQKAIDTYKRGLKTNPQEPMLYLNIGFNFNRLKEIDSAISYFSSGIQYGKKCDPSKVGLLTFTTREEQSEIKASQFYYERGLDYFQQEQYTLCIDDMKKCIECGYMLAESHYMVGASHNSLGNKTKGCEHLNIALSYGDELANELIIQNCQ